MGYFIHTDSSLKEIFSKAGLMIGNGYIVEDRWIFIASGGVFETVAIKYEPWVGLKGVRIYSLLYFFQINSFKFKWISFIINFIEI